jgi:hypothetical protein
MELLFREKTPSFPRKYQTSAIPNISDQAVFITRNIYRHENNCCFLTSKNLFPKIYKAESHWTIWSKLALCWPLTFDLWSWHKVTQKLFFFVWLSLQSREQIIVFLKNQKNRCDGTVFRETVYREPYAVTVRYGIIRIEAVYGMRRYSNFAIPSVSGSNDHASNFDQMFKIDSILKSPPLLLPDLKPLANASSSW